MHVVTPFLRRLHVVVAVAVLSGCVFDDEDTQHQAFTGRCVSTAEDPKDLGLRGATVRTVDDGVEVTWTTSKPMDQDAGYWVNLTDDYGVMRRQLYYFSTRARETEEKLGLDPGSLPLDEYIATVNDRREGETFLDDVDPQIVGPTVRVVFPHSVIEPPEGSAPYYWYAGIDLGELPKQDLCPDPRSGDDWPTPPLGPLPST